jgi:hypothetical protein
VTTEEMEWSDYGRRHGARCWILFIFPLAAVDYILCKWAIMLFRLVLGV